MGNKSNKSSNKMEKQKEPIRLRKKQLANGNTSLYLDIYYNEKRDYEFLKMYLVPEKTKADKERNRQTLQLANSVKAKRIIEMQNGVYGFNSAFKLDVNFIDYYSSLTEKRKKEDSNGNHGNWDSAMKHLLKYCKASTTFREIDEDFYKGFKEYLETKARTKSGVPLSQNSQHSYFCKLKACGKASRLIISFSGIILAGVLVGGCPSSNFSALTWR